MGKGIRLSRKHGVNPSVMLCFFCNEPAGVALLGRRPDDTEAPRQAVFDKTPCEKCKAYMEQGVILISVDEQKSAGDLENPYRTGGWVVVKDELVRRIVQPAALAESILRSRVAFVPDDAWDKLGLPRGEKKVEP